MASVSFSLKLSVIETCQDMPGICRKSADVWEQYDVTAMVKSVLSRYIVAAVSRQSRCNRGG